MGLADMGLYQDNTVEQQCLGLETRIQHIQTDRPIANQLTPTYHYARYITPYSCVLGIVVLSAAGMTTAECFALVDFLP